MSMICTVAQISTQALAILSLRLSDLNKEVSVRSALTLHVTLQLGHTVQI